MILWQLQFSVSLVLNWTATSFVLCAQRFWVPECWVGLLWGAQDFSQFLCEHHSLPREANQEGRQIPETKQTKKKQKCRLSFFSPLNCLSHATSSFPGSLATRYREMLPKPHGWDQLVILTYLWFWHLSEPSCRAVGAQLSPSSPRLCPQASFFHLSRDLLSVPHCTQLGKPAEASEVVLNPCMIQIVKGSCNASFLLPLGFIHGHLSLLRCSGISLSPCQHCAVSHWQPRALSCGWCTQRSCILNNSSAENKGRQRWECLSRRTFNLCILIHLLLLDLVSCRYIWACGPPECAHFCFTLLVTDKIKVSRACFHQDFYLHPVISLQLAT